MFSFKFILPDRIFYYTYKINEFFERKCVRVIAKEYAHKRKPTKWDKFSLRYINGPIEFRLRKFIAWQRGQRKAVGKTHLPAHYFE